jgi:hypothetical protein
LSRKTLRRWSVPAIAIASLVVPILVSGCIEIDGPEGCMCLDCYYALVEEGTLPDRTFRASDAEPPDPNDEAKDEETSEQQNDPRRAGPGKVPDAVTRPRIDPNLRGNQGYPKPSGPKY